MTCPAAVNRGGRDRVLCPGCGFNKFTDPPWGGEVCPPCQRRGYAPEPAGSARRGMDGGQARAQLESQFADPAEIRSLARERQERRYAAEDGVAGENEYLMWRAARLRAARLRAEA